MGKDHPNASKRFHHLCPFLLAVSLVSLVYFIYWSQFRFSCNVEPGVVREDIVARHDQSFNLLSFPSALNKLSFSPKPPARLLKLAVFVKRWPRSNLAGGLERHALTLHLALARRGHEVHVFTTMSNYTISSYPNAAITFHVTPPSPAGYLNQALAWEQFREQNATGKPFDVVHSESVALFHGRARNLSKLAVSWHGIAYETIHSDIVQDLLRGPQVPRHPAVTERLPRVIDEVKFFRDYAHHVATSDHVGDVLKRIYMIPEERVHIIVNGVDEGIYKPNPERGQEFRRKIGVPDNNASLVIGLAGRLVKDKGHPLMFEALKQVFMEDESLRRRIFVLVAGDGPWGNRYKELGPNMLILGPLGQPEMAAFYNSLDVFLNPTLRAQGLDHTLIEAMLSGVSITGTRFASITGSLIVSPEIGYTFLPTVESLKECLHRMLKDGNHVVRKKGEVARDRAARLFTATKMAAAYERLLLCIARRAEGNDGDPDYCTYPLPWD